MASVRRGALNYVKLFGFIFLLLNLVDIITRFLDVAMVLDLVGLRANTLVFQTGDSVEVLLALG